MPRLVRDKKPHQAVKHIFELPGHIPPIARSPDDDAVGTTQQLGYIGNVVVDMAL